MASNINSLNILDPIYQDVIDNTKIQSGCDGSGYHRLYRYATVVSGSISFVVDGYTYALFTSTNGPSDAVACWNLTSSGGVSTSIYLYIEDTTYNYSTNRLTVNLSGMGSAADRRWTTVNFTMRVVSCSETKARLAITRVRVTDRDGDTYTANYSATIEINIDAMPDVKASIYGNNETIADWRDFNPTIRVNV